MIDQEKLLAFFGIRNDTRPDANKIKQENEKLRGYLVDALCRRGTALCRLYLLATPGAARDLLNGAIQYGVWYWFTGQQWARAVKLLQRMQEERPSRELDERLAQAYQQLGWRHLAHTTQRAMPARYPPAYRPF
ncbi:hypothetical protein ACJJTC_007748 [Scirpophaga incertulas]